MYYEKLTVRINEKVVCEQTKTFSMGNCIWSFENKLVKIRAVFKDVVLLYEYVDVYLHVSLNLHFLFCCQFSLKM